MDSDVEASQSPSSSRKSFSADFNEPLLGVEMDGTPIWNNQFRPGLLLKDRIPFSAIFNLIALLASAGFLIGTVLGLTDLDRRCANKLNSWSPLQDIVDFESSVLDSERISIYTGEWTEDSYEAWHALLNYPAIGITEDKLPLLNKSDAVTWKRHDENSQFPGQIEAFIEGHHRMHCLLLIRMYSFRDRFNFTHDRYMNEQSDKVLRHVEHCIDNVRWGIQCRADVTPYFFERTVEPGAGRHVPRLVVRRPAKCRNIQTLEKYLAEDLHLAEPEPELHTGH